MAETAAEAAAGETVCSPSLADKSKGCSEAAKSSEKTRLSEVPKENGVALDGPVLQSEEEPGPDPRTSEETKIQEDLKESEDPKKPDEEKKDKVKTDEEEKSPAGDEAKEEPLGPDDVVCDSCIESPCRALKSCLTCLVSYCEAHLRPHLENPKFSNHRLVDPLRDIERRTCESHKWPLDFFCCADACCVCQDCVAEEHRGHNTVAVVEARRQIEVRQTHTRIIKMLSLIKFQCNFINVKRLNVYFYFQISRKKLILRI